MPFPANTLRMFMVIGFGAMLLVGLGTFAHAYWRRGAVEPAYAVLAVLGAVGVALAFYTRSR
jgi:hypothetical protein